LKRTLHSPDVHIGSLDRRPDATEHRQLLEAQGFPAIRSREELVGRFLRTESRKLRVVDFLIRYVQEHGVQSIISLGAGTGVPEYLIALATGCQVVASDYDPLHVRQASDLLGIQACEFDITGGDFSKFPVATSSPKLVLLVGSAYVMDDEEFVHLLGSMAAAGRPRVLDFELGYIDLPTRIALYRRDLVRLPMVRQVFRRAHAPALGKMHGFQRDRAALRTIYRRAGWKLAREFKLPPYSYAAELH